jgi:hypothetical protein
MEEFWGVTPPTVGRYSRYKIKYSELWLAHNPEPHVEVHLDNLIFYPHPFQYILSLMSFTINNQEIFQTNSSKHNIITRNKHHLQTYLVFKLVHSMLAKIFTSFPPTVTFLKNEKAKFKAAITKYRHTHCF